MLCYQRTVKKVVTKNGFLIFSFLVYLGLYTFLCAIIFYFCLFFIQLINKLQDKSRAFYAYHTIQKRFIDDCQTATDAYIKNNKLKIIFSDNKITWRIKGISLIRKEHQHAKNDDNKKTSIYFCTVAKDFVPVIHQKGLYACAEFTISLFSNPFIFSAIMHRKEG